MKNMTFENIFFTITILLDLSSIVSFRTSFITN